MHKTCSAKCVHYKIYTNNINKEQYTELKEKIISVQSENDKRIVVLLWGIGILVPTVALIVGFTLRSNKSSVIQSAQETARTEFIREFKFFKRKFNSTFKELQEKKQEIEAIKEEIELLKFEFEQNSEMQKAAIIQLQSIQVNKDENSDSK